MKSIHERAYAKVNFWLEILGKRPDGFHELETVMHEIALFDDVILTPADHTMLIVSDPSVGLGEDNLAIKALRAVERHVGYVLPVSIELIKRIPAGGGLGGGSSDAAAVIRGLNQLFDLALNVKEMERIAGLFGSDTSFFIRGGTALCRGRGEIIEGIELNRTFVFVVVFPGIHVPTGAIFRALTLTQDPQPVYDFLDALTEADVGRLRGLFFNRLEQPAQEEHGDLAEILGPLKSQGFLMSGSGSTLFYLASGREPAEHLALKIQKEYKIRAEVLDSAVR